MSQDKDPLSFRISEYVVPHHDEQELRGTDHTIHFEAGIPTEIDSYRVGRVVFAVGGAERNGDGLGVVTDILARIDFPPKDEVELKGRFTSDLTPLREELVVLAGSLMLMLGKQRIESLSITEKSNLDTTPKHDALRVLSMAMIPDQLHTEMVSTTSELLN